MAHVCDGTGWSNDTQCGHDSVHDCDPHHRPNGNELMSLRAADSEGPEQMAHDRNTSARFEAFLSYLNCFETVWALGASLASPRILLGLWGQTN